MTLLVIMRKVTGDSIDDDSGEAKKDDDIVTVTSADGLIDAQIIAGDVVMKNNKLASSKLRSQSETITHRPTRSQE